MACRTSCGAALLILAFTAAHLGAQTTIDFEGLGSTSLSGSVPESAQLSTALQGQGVRFSSGSLFVAVLQLGAGHATSGALGIGGTTPGGDVSFDSPIFIEFLNPANPAQRATTSSVSIRADHLGSGLPIQLNAFDVFGALIGSSTVTDSGGATLSVAASGIQRVEVIGNGTAAFDDLSFGALTPVPASVTPEPATLALLGTGMLALGWAARRKRIV
jgi:hypothetical protein